MTSNKNTKRALLTSALAIFMCVTMLIGTTFAWFTDTATSAVNKIQSGTLDVALQMAIQWNEVGEPTKWDNAEGKTLEFRKASDANGTEVLWESGCTYELPQLRVVNNGNLALKYKIAITGITGSAKLNEAIEWTMNIGNYTIDLENGEYMLLEKGATSDTITISGHMKEKAGNEYQNLSIDSIGITVVATQLDYEYDSNGNDYDKNALYPEYIAPVSSEVTGNLTVNNVGSSDITTATVKGGDQKISDSVMTVAYPEGTILSTTSVSTDGSETKTTVGQSLKYVGTEAKGEGVEVTSTQDVASYALTLPLAESNEMLVTVTINYTPGLKNVVVYHSGKQLGTSSTDTTNTDGEYFTYNSKDGALVLYLKHASPIDIVYDKAVLAIEGDTLVNAYALQNVPGVYDAATKTLTIPEGIKSVSEYALYKNGKTGAFSDKERLSVEKLVLPSSLESIGNEAFYAGDLTEIVWPEDCKIKHIGNGAFNYCRSLTEINLPDSIETMGIGVFANCTSLKKVSGLPEAYIKNVPQGMFGKCPLVVSENTWLTNMETIDVGAFKEAFASGEKLDLSNAALTSIAQEGFRKSNLAEVILPNTLTSVGVDAFRDCSSLEKLTLPTGNTTYGSNAFRNCNVKAITLAEGSTSIGTMFKGNTSIEELTLPSTLETIENEAFKGCSSLKKVNFPDALKTIGENAFRGTALSDVFIPSNVETIGNNAFRDIENIRCAAASKPAGWDKDWTNKSKTVEWGAKS